MEEKPLGLLKRKVYRHNGTLLRMDWGGVREVEERRAVSGREACCLVETLPRVVLGETPRQPTVARLTTSTWHEVLASERALHS
jgi:hypothetical protein